MQLFLTAAKLDKIIKRKSIFDEKSIGGASKKWYNATGFMCRFG